MANSGYPLRFWGSRGPTPTPGRSTIRYGGETSCVSVALDEREHVVLDCGSGLRHLGREMRRKSGRFHLFLSHYHFDHIEGLPLFQPLYEAGSSLTVHGPRLCDRTAQEILEEFIRPPYFPVTLAHVPSTVDYATVDGEPVTVRDVTIDSAWLNHPDGSVSFRLTRGDRRIVYATDHEHGNEAIDRGLIELSRGADYLIYDATYQPAEYEELRRGWGHSTWYAAVQTALAARVKTLILFHHHPDHSDEELERVLSVARKDFPATELSGPDLDLRL
jgi:phosphoribosyl 1,2-cyclic phosphodiesterase